MSPQRVGFHSSVANFQGVFHAFEDAKAERCKAWPTAFAEFQVAFKVARKDRAEYTPRLNILDVFGLKAWELCHSRVVAWFLDENESHEQGSLFMECLLRHCGAIGAACTGYKVQREKPARVDVVAYKSREFAVFIENKVEHHERDGQLKDLQTALVEFSTAHRIPESHRIAVFLTDDGREPLTAHEQPPTGLLAIERCTSAGIQD
jgi:hypothetical protein